MKFKVGDRVKVVRLHRFSLPEKRSYLGKTFFISKVYNNNGRWSYRSDCSGGGYAWCDEELELVESKTFTKSNLKDGMVVELRNGELYLVVGQRFLGRHSWFNFKDIDDDLSGGIINIVKVYSVIDGATDILDVLDCAYLSCIWERKEELDYKEMTVEEVEERLGYKIKVVADK